ncbi:hypothetical protein CYMTET_31510, partial [Cymbomonas tetramitiformis]
RLEQAYHAYMDCPYGGKKEPAGTAASFCISIEDAFAAAVRQYVAPVVVSAGSIESDLDVSAYSFHVEEDSAGSDGDDVLAELHKIT